MTKKQETLFVNKETKAILYDPIYWGQDSGDFFEVPLKKHEFEAVLQLVSYEELSESKCDHRFLFVDLTTGQQHKMFLDDFVQLATNNDLAKGIIAGQWGFNKRFDRIGIKMKTPTLKTKNASTDTIKGRK